MKNIIFFCRHPYDAAINPFLETVIPPPIDFHRLSNNALIALRIVKLR